MKFLPILLVLCLVLGACSHDPAGPDPVPAATIDQILEAAGKVAPLGPEHNDVTDSTAVAGNYRYYYEKHDALENLENITCLGLNDDVIWTGSLVRGEHVYDYVYEPITIPRSPIKLSISLEGTGSGDRCRRWSPSPPCRRCAGASRTWSRAPWPAMSAPRPRSTGRTRRCTAPRR